MIIVIQKPKSLDEVHQPHRYGKSWWEGFNRRFILVRSRWKNIQQKVNSLKMERSRFQNTTQWPLSNYSGNKVYEFTHDFSLIQHFLQKGMWLVRRNIIPDTWSKIYALASNNWNKDILTLWSLLHTSKLVIPFWQLSSEKLQYYTYLSHQIGYRLPATLIIYSIPGSGDKFDIIQPQCSWFNYFTTCKLLLFWISIRYTEQHLT